MAKDRLPITYINFFFKSILSSEMLYVREDVVIIGKRSSYEASIESNFIVKRR
jgi:hypothetical protein